MIGLVICAAYAAVVVLLFVLSFIVFGFLWVVRDDMIISDLINLIWAVMVWPVTSLFLLGALLGHLYSRLRPRL